eukprot:11324158-Karenia_brevis.AAC.1
MAFNLLQLGLNLLLSLFPFMPQALSMLHLIMRLLFLLLSIYFIIYHIMTCLVLIHPFVKRSTGTYGKSFTLLWPAKGRG